MLWNKCASTDALWRMVRGNVDSLMKLVDALAANGIKLIAEGAIGNRGGREVRLI